MQHTRSQALILGAFLCLGLLGLGYFVADAAIAYKKLDRTVSVKGLSEREYLADIVIWPIQYAVATNDLDELYVKIDRNNAKISAFLLDHQIQKDEITFSLPAIVDRSAQQYGYTEQTPFRYSANQNVTVYSSNIETVRAAMSQLSEIGKQGIVITGGDYQSQTEYIFTRLNDIKPAMIEEATNEARAVAEKFAQDSDSRLGKIASASQGQFSIFERDKNNPHIKKVRVVSTVHYYLVD